MGLERVTDAVAFHAGTKKNQNQIVTDGGRVISMMALGTDLATAREKAYRGASILAWDGLYFRKDIGLDLLALQTK